MPVQPTVSVIIPTHQSGRYLVQTLQSIAKQSHQISQLVISDDASTDDTHDIVRQFRQQVAFEVLLFNHKPSGVTNNYLNAAQHASSDLIIVGDHDDVWLPSKVAETVAAFVDESVMLVCHDSELVDESLKPLGTTIRGGSRVSQQLSQQINANSAAENLRTFFRGRLPLLAHTLSFRKSVLPLLLSKPERFNEWWFEEWLSCVAATQGRLFFIPHCLVRYRQHSEQSSGGFDAARPEARTEAAIDKSKKYVARIDQFRHCLTLIPSEQTERLKIWQAYVDFLHQRQADLAGTNVALSLLNACRQLIAGKYHLYANGVRSFGLDVLLITRLRRLWIT